MKGKKCRNKINRVGGVDAKGILSKISLWVPHYVPSLTQQTETDWALKT